MRFLPDREQSAFAASLDAMLSRADTPAVVREWSRGEHAGGRALWRRLAGAGLFSLAAEEEAGGVGLRPVELALAFVELGRHAVPGPLVETVTAATLLPDPKLTERLVSGELMATMAYGIGGGPGDGGWGTPATGPDDPHGGAPDAGPDIPHEGTPATGPDDPHTGAPDAGPGSRGEGARGDGGRQDHPGGHASPGRPSGHAPPGQPALSTGRDSPGKGRHGLGRVPYALDGDVADLRLLLTSEGLFRCAGHGPVRHSLDPARRLTTLEDPEPLAPAPAPAPAPAGRSITPKGGEPLSTEPPTDRALALARLATAAQSLGVGLALLDRTVAHVRRRTQFGAPVGSFQAVKHRLADAMTALEFARPLVLGAALTLSPAEVAAAKLAACEAAYATARTALQLHGAIGYTAECDLSLWLTKARALRTAWGGPDECRDAVLRGGDRRW
ncbi:acyl-CoA dehydrogenase family protein [Streptomyces sp. NPDC058867]|uniref:acyl-CoA dehydrogenase family protein n=1 Tax=unclassified Streptomyces TaxID=2593676 RepID=UPI0036C38679